MTAYIGELKHEIQIQREIGEINEYGILQRAWKSIRITRAKVVTNYNSKSEKSKNDGNSYLPRKEFTIRKLNGDITTADRIIYKKQIYNIILIEDLDEDGMYINILAQIESK